MNVHFYPTLLMALVLSLAGSGCASSSIASRRTEKLAVYSTLSPEHQTLVDAGQVRAGMPADAVYIAWGPPAEVLESESSQGLVTTWLYHGTVVEDHRYWNYREVRDGNHTHLERFLDHEYDPRSYVQAEIILVDGRVKSWRTLPRPH